LIIQASYVNHRSIGFPWVDKAFPISHRILEWFFLFPHFLGCGRLTHR